MKKRFLRSAVSFALAAALVFGDAGAALAAEPGQVTEAQTDDAYDEAETPDAEVTVEPETVAEEATEEAAEEISEEASTEADEAAEEISEISEEATEAAEEETEIADELSAETATSTDAEELDAQKAAVATPTVDSVSVSTNDTTTLNVDVAVHAYKYEIYVNDKLSNTYYTSTYTGSSTAGYTYDTYTATNAISVRRIPGKTYTIKVVPYDVAGNAYDAKTATKKTSSIKPTFTTSYSYTTTSSGYKQPYVYLSLYWSNASSSTEYYYYSSVSYDIYRSTSKSGTYKKIGSASSSYGYSTSYYDYTAEVGKTYYYKIKGKFEKPYDGYTSSTYTSDFTSAKSGKITKLSAPTVYTSFNEKNKVTLYINRYPSYDWSWGSEYASGYEIYRSTKKSSGFKKIARVSKNTYVDSSAKQGTTYYYKARAYYYNTSKKTYTYGSYSDATGIKYLMGYLSLNAEQKSTTSAKISWDKVYGADSYEVYYKSSMTGDAYKLAGTTTGKSYTVKGLSSSVDYYYFQVLACKKSGGVTTYYVSNSCSLNMGLHSPSPYISKRTYSYNSSKKTYTVKTTISWDKVYGASGYKIRKYTYNYSTDTSKTTDVTKLGSGKTSYTVTNTYSASSSSNTYSYYYVVAYKGSDEYSSSVYVSSGLKNVTGVTVKKSSGSAKISWKSVAGATSYSVYRTSSMGVSQWLDSVSTTSYTDTTPTPGVEYTYTVYSYSSTLGLSSDSNYGTENRSKSVTLSAPKTTISSAKNSKSKTATLTLKKVTGAKKYVIYRSTSKDGKYTKIGETSSTTYTDKKLTKGTRYFYKVKVVSVNDAGISLTSGFSAYKSVKITK